MKLIDGDLVYVQKENNENPDKWHKSKEIYIIRDQDNKAAFLKITHKVDNDYVVYKTLEYDKNGNKFIYDRGYKKPKILDYFGFIVTCSSLDIPNRVVEDFIKVCKYALINKNKIHFINL